MDTTLCRLVLHAEIELVRILFFCLPPEDLHMPKVLIIVKKTMPTDLDGRVQRLGKILLKEPLACLQSFLLLVKVIGTQFVILLLFKQPESSPRKPGKQLQIIYNWIIE